MFSYKQLYDDADKFIREEKEHRLKQHNGEIGDDCEVCRHNFKFSVMWLMKRNLINQMTDDAKKELKLGLWKRLLLWLRLPYHKLNH